MVVDPVKAKRISDILLAEYGVYVQPINFPTVPRGTERLRFTPGPTHNEVMMRELTDALVEIWGRMRSEEHTSELQSLMRISYAVFCLKKKKSQNPYASRHQHKSERSHNIMT